MIGETTLPVFEWKLIAVLCALGLASAIIQLVMNWAQRIVDPRSSCDYLCR